MTETKKQKLRERQIELLKMFDGDFYQEKQVDNEWYIKSWNGGTNKWQVSIYSEVAYRRYKSFNGEKIKDCKACNQKICKCSVKSFKAPTLADVKEIVDKKQRTILQNKAVHKLFTTLSDQLNTLGLDMKLILKPSYQIWWTPESVKRDLWKPLQKAMLDKESTADLNTDEVSKVYEQLAKIIGEKHNVEIEFPSVEQTKNYLESFKQ